MPQYALRTARFPVNNPAAIKLTSLLADLVAARSPASQPPGMSSSSGSGRPGGGGYAVRSIAEELLALGRYCCKSRKSNDSENFAKVDF